MNMEELSYKVRGAIFEVFRQLGPGMLEKTYCDALIQELSLQKIKVKKEVEVPVYYKGVKLEIGFRIDLLVEDAIVIEVKSVSTLNDVHKKQLLTYLKLADKRLGFLVNFNEKRLIDQQGIFRLAN